VWASYNGVRRSGNSYDYLQAELSAWLFPEQFEEVAAGVGEIAVAPVAPDREEAEGLLSFFERQAQGRAFNDLEDILACHPRYTSSPEAEMAEGWKKYYEVADIPEARGAAFSFHAPASWREIGHSYKSGVLNYFITGNGIGLASLAVLALDLPKDGVSISETIFEATAFALEQGDEAFLKAEIRDQGTGDGGKYPWEWLVIEWIRGIENEQHTFIQSDFVFPRPGGLISLRFFLADYDSGEGTRMNDFELYKGLYKRIAESVVFNEEEEAPRGLARIMRLFGR